ncbi:MAG: putative acyl-CoA synthetase [Candidatus Moranbacteria bacterium GW2011_GWF2_35_39]|nr:MAG: putative acyl-CoA synthetase [Candidatus Moranbacteria bacterium GW2011_GWF2_35_39]
MKIGYNKIVELLFCHCEGVSYSERPWQSRSKLEYLNYFEIASLLRQLADSLAMTVLLKIKQNYMSLDKLFNPKSIAIVGASSEEGKIGNVIAKNILELGYGGEVYLVNPKYSEIFGKKCYKSLGEIFEDKPALSAGMIDLAILAIPAKFVNQEILNNSKNIKNYVVISAGFSEIGEEGKKQEEELKKIAKENELNILGPNCLGFIIPSLKLNASFAGGMPEAGNISFVSQSGALAVALMDSAKKEGIKFSSIVSIGNKMEIGEVEMLEFLAQDENTKVIGMYLEGIKDGEKFIEMAENVSRLKPIVILKAGKNEKTQQAIASHTGALAGDDEIVSAVFEKAGIIRANNLEEFFNLLKLISFSRTVPNQKVAVITNAGGAGVLISDAFNGKKIKLAELNEETKNKLREFLPAESSVENPIDLLGDARADRYEKTLEVISEIEEIGSIICLLTPQQQTPVEEIAEEIIKFKNKTNKIIVTVFLGGEKVEKEILKLKQNGICNFNFPDLAVRAIDGYSQWNEFRKIKTKTKTQMINEKRRSIILEIIQSAKSQNRQALYFEESAKIMALYGINTTKSFEAENYQKENFSYPVALKIDSDKILHKTDKAGLILNIEDEKKLEENIAKMKRNFPGSRFIIQPMAQKGTELIMGIKKDEIFGPVIIYGLGGIYTEVFRMVDYLIPPFNLKQTEESLMNGKIRFLFSGMRGQKKYNMEEIAKILLGIGSLALEIPEIGGFDINPLIVYNNNQEAIVVDVKIII